MLYKTVRHHCVLTALVLVGFVTWATASADTVVTGAGSI